MEQKLEFQKNCFDPMRYWAALSVMLLHYTGYALKLSDSGADVLHIIRKIVAFFPGVVILFALSGFLVSASFERCKNQKEFFIKRVFRMYPELWACTIVNLSVVLILVNKGLDKSILIWLLTQILGIAYTPACLNTFATGSVNGALWTIFTEIQLYVVLGIFYNRMKKWGIGKWCVLLLSLAAINILSVNIATFHNGIDKIIERSFLPYSIWFFIGVFCYVNRACAIPKLKKAFPILLIVYVLFRELNIKAPGYYADIIVGILCPLIVIGGGYLLPSVRIKKDITYGMFLYHWIVLNVIVYFNLMNKLSWGLCVFLFIGGSLSLAWISNVFVGMKSRRIVDYIVHRRENEK